MKNNTQLVVADAPSKFANATTIQEHPLATGINANIDAMSVLADSIRSKLAERERLLEEARREKEVYDRLKAANTVLETEFAQRVAS